MPHLEDPDKILEKFPPVFLQDSCDFLAKQQMEQVATAPTLPPHQFNGSNMTANGKCSLLGNHGAPLNKYTVLPSLRYNYKAMSFHLSMYLF